MLTEDFLALVLAVYRDGAEQALTYSDVLTRLGRSAPETSRSSVRRAAEALAERGDLLGRGHESHRRYYAASGGRLRRDPDGELAGEVPAGSPELAPDGNVAGAPVALVREDEAEDGLEPGDLALLEDRPAAPGETAVRGRPVWKHFREVSRPGHGRRKIPPR